MRIGDGHSHREHLGLHLYDSVDTTATSVWNSVHVCLSNHTNETAPGEPRVGRLLATRRRLKDWRRRLTFGNGNCLSERVTNR